MHTLKYCQLCLVVDVRTFAMNTATLEVYSKLLQLPLHNREPNICHECSALLLKYQEFRAKCLRAHNVLTHFQLQRLRVITQEMFEAQRKIFNLESKLSLTTVAHDILGCQHDHSRNTVIVCNINSREKSVCNVNNMLHVTDESKPLQYIESASAHDKLTEFKWFEETLEANSIVTKDNKEIIELTDTPITDLDNGPLDNIVRSENLVNTAKETNDEAVNEDNYDYSYLEDEPISDNDSTEDNNLDEIVVFEITNSEGLVEQTSQLAQSVLLEKFTIANEESNTTNADLDDKLSRNIGYNDPVMTATRIAHHVQKKGKDLVDRFFKGFAKVVRLTEEMARNEVLLRKDSSNYRNSAYKCEICYLGFLTEVGYKNHVKKHDKERPAECEFCHITFAKRKRLVKHVNLLHSYKIICMRCDYVTCSVPAGRIHIGKHKGTSYACYECGLSFSRQNTLHDHKQRVHPLEHVCALCGDKFGTTRSLAAHKSLLHAQESPALSGPRCAECALQFATEAAYDRHLVVSDKHNRDGARRRQKSQNYNKHKTHAGDRVCALCGDEFGTARRLASHKRLLHAQDSPAVCGPRCAECSLHFASEAAYERHLVVSDKHNSGPDGRKFCRFCGKTFPDSKKLSAHVRLWHKLFGPLLLCPECPARLPSDHMLWKHMSARHPRAELPPPARNAANRAEISVCEYCGRNVNRYQLQYHIREHTGARPYKCEECGKGFAHPTVFNMHKRTHASVPIDKQYQCETCFKNFKFESALRKHIMTVHFKIRRHACHICGKTFFYLCDVNVHVKYTHENVPWPKRIKSEKLQRIIN